MIASDDDNEDGVFIQNHATTPLDFGHVKLTEKPKRKETAARDPYDVDEDMEALLGYERFIPKEHIANCHRAIVVGPDEDVNTMHVNALLQSGAFQLVDICTNPVELPSCLLKNTDSKKDVVVCVLSGFRGPLRVALFHSMQLYTHKRSYSDFSMIYAGATSDAAWTMVLALQDTEDIPYKNKYMYRYHLPT